MNEELKPCPFCSSDAYELRPDELRPGGNSVVCCYNCDASILAPKGKAKDRWNTRFNCGAKESAQCPNCILTRAPEGDWRVTLETICEAYLTECRNGGNVPRAIDAVINTIGRAPSAPPHIWQPIETAPKDGTQILIFSRAEGRAIASFSHIDADGTVWWKSGEFPDYSSGATHWLPLPKGPSEEVADD
jgi:hypothetical protein